MDEDFQEYVLYPTNNEPNFRFIGRLVDSVSSRRPGSIQWTELNAYQTRAGKWVVESVGATSVETMERRVSVYVFEDPAAMTAKLGYGRISAKLYRKLGFKEISVE